MWYPGGFVGGIQPAAKLEQGQLAATDLAVTTDGAGGDSVGKGFREGVGDVYQGERWEGATKSLDDSYGKI